MNKSKRILSALHRYQGQLDMGTIDAVAVLRSLRDIQSVLENLSSSEEELEAAVSRLRDVLSHCAQNEVWRERNSTFDFGIVKALLGILRSSSNLPLVAEVVKCLALLVHGNEEGRRRLGEVKNLFQLLVNLLIPRRVAVPVFRVESSPRYAWEISRSEVYEQVLGLLRKLTYLNGDNQVRLAQSGGIKLIVNLSVSNLFLHNSGHFSMESKQCLEHLTLGKKLACRATIVPNSSTGAVLSSFQALSGENSVVTAQYPAFYISLATDEKNWVSSTMIDMGVVWPDHTPFPMEGSKWTRVIVTNIENGNSVWCQFWKEKPDARLEAMLKSLDMVRYLI